MLLGAYLARKVCISATAILSFKGRREREFAIVKVRATG